LQEAEHKKRKIQKQLEEKKMRQQLIEQKLQMKEQDRQEDRKVDEGILHQANIALENERNKVALLKQKEKEKLHKI